MSYVDQASDSTPEINLTTTGKSQAPDVPVNPYSLLEAVNASSAAARGGWVLFLAITSFILIAVAGVTHRDLLLNTKVDLPILQVEIELTRFFLFAPILLLFVHFGMLIQHVMLSRKTLEFDKSLRSMEPTRRPTHPLRLELHSYFFTQALAGPQRGWLLAGFLHAMVWISLVVLPVLVMLFTQVVFLPYHDYFITWVHRIVLSLDMLILLAVGVFLRRTEASFFGAFFRVARNHPMNFVVTGSLFIVILLLSFFIATIPGEHLDTLRPKSASNENSRQLSAGDQGVFKSAADILSGTRDTMKNVLDKMFSRDLIVTDIDLVSNKDDAAGEFSVVLRNRNLRNAQLDRSDLHRADLAGADLRGASLVGTDLRGARFGCSPKQCTLLQDADFSGANLTKAEFTGARMNKTILEDAKLASAVLKDTDLTGADLTGADLRRANLTGGVNLYGANFLNANLRGAYLTGANMQGADFSSATLEGASLPWANAVGANFSNAQLDGAYMPGAKLQGASLDGATMAGTDLSDTSIWRTSPPKASTFLLTNTTGMSMKRISDALRRSIEIAIEKDMGEAQKRRLETILTTIVAEEKKTGPDWSSLPHYDIWKTFKERGAQNDPNYKVRLTAYLADLACQIRWQEGAVADGVITRALEFGFPGDMVEIEHRLTNPSCPASGNLSPELRKELADKIEEAQAKLNQTLTTPPLVDKTE